MLQVRESVRRKSSLFIGAVFTELQTAKDGHRINGQLISKALAALERGKRRELSDIDRALVASGCEREVLVFSSH